MSDDAATSAGHHLKLFVDPNGRRQVFAVASAEAIEFLHSLLVSPHVSLPFDAATRNACIANVYDSVEELRAIAEAADISRSPSPQRQQQDERFFVCCGGWNGSGAGASSCSRYVSDKSGARCPACGGQMAVEVPRGCPGASCSDADDPDGMKWPPDLTCVLLDNLEVLSLDDIIPISMMTGIQQTVVFLGYTEAMEILETSLRSSTVLSDVFLCKNKKVRRFGKSPQ